MSTVSVERALQEEQRVDLGMFDIFTVHTLTKLFTDQHGSPLQEKQAATNRILLKKERASGFQDGRLDVVAHFNGSTEALDRLDEPPAKAPLPAPATVAAASASSAEAVSPTVSQLSAKFEKAEPQNNVYLSQRRSGPALAPKPKPPAPAEPTERQVREEEFHFLRFWKLGITLLLLLFFN